MAKNYQQLQSQIDRLQKQADAVRKKELSGVVQEIKSVIAQWGLTAEDLGLAEGSGPRRRAAKKVVPVRAKKTAKNKASVTGGTKYQDKDGNVWGGRGPRPAWLRTALEAGRSLDEFLV